MNQTQLVQSIKGAWPANRDQKIYDTLVDLTKLDGITAAELRTIDPGQVFTLFEDFGGTWAIGDAGPADYWSTTAGSGTGNQVATTVANSINGEVTMTSSSVNGTAAQNGTTLTAVNLGWKANQGGLAIEARVKISAITGAYIFIGFTDTISTTVEYPIFLTAGDIDSDATNACGVCFDTAGTTAQWFQGGVKADVDTAPTYSGTAPVAATYVTVRVEVGTDGSVQGFIDGAPIGKPTLNAVTVTTALTPAVFVANRGAAARVLTVDYVSVQQNR